MRRHGRGFIFPSEIKRYSSKCLKNVNRLFETMGMNRIWIKSLKIRDSGTLDAAGIPCSHFRELYRYIKRKTVRSIDLNYNRLSIPNIIQITKDIV